MIDHEKVSMVARQLRRHVGADGRVEIISAGTNQKRRAWPIDAAEIIAGGSGKLASGKIFTDGDPSEGDEKFADIPLDAMTKDQLAAYAIMRHGLNIDRRKSNASIVAEIKDLESEAKDEG